MFDLEKAIADWRRDLKARGVRRRGALDEMESHLREAVGRFTGEGMGEEKAFRQAKDEMGEAGALGKEFGKVERKYGAVLEILEDGAVALREGWNWFPLSFFQLLLGFSFILATVGVIGYLLTAYDHMNTATRDWAIKHFLPFILIYLTLGVWGVRAGVARRRREGRTGAVVLIALVLALLLVPVSCTGGVWGIYYGNEVAVRIMHEDKLVGEAISPDGRWRAYVIDKPTVDEPDNRLMLEEAGKGKGRYLARLYNDLDFNLGIEWSPRGDIVVYRNKFTLVAARVADGKCAAVPLIGRAPKADQPGATYEERYGKVGRVSFTGNGGIRYTLQGENGEFEVGAAEFRFGGESAFLVDPYYRG